MSSALQGSRRTLLAFKPGPRSGSWTPVSRSSRRLQSTSSSSSGSPSSAVIGGLAGGGIVLGLGYAYYHTSGAKTAINTISDTKNYIENATKQLKTGNLKPDESLQWLRSTVYQYTALIPGGRQYADSVFKTADQLKDQHGEEFNKIVANAQAEMMTIASEGSISVDSAKKAWDCLLKYLDQIQDLAKDATNDVLKQNPELKAQFGDQLEKLHEIREKGGKQAQNAVDEVWSKIEQVTKSGSINSGQIGKFIQEGLQKAQQMGDETWHKILEAAQPYLDKDPELKKLVQQGYDKFNGSDASELSEKLQEAARTGNMDDLKTFAQSKMKDVQDISDDAWQGAKARLSIYLDKHPDLKQAVEGNPEVFKNIDFEEFLAKLREARDSGNIQPVKDYVEQQLRKSKK